MNTPEQPAGPPLTRKQMRELRNTGANPIVTQVAEEEQPVAAPAPEPIPAPAPLPRAAEPALVAEPPVPDSAVDLGVSPLTRRQARQQERIRTASVPVITPDLAAAHTASTTVEPTSPAPGTDQDAVARLFGAAPLGIAPADGDTGGDLPAADDLADLGFDPEPVEDSAVAGVGDGDEGERERVVDPHLGAALLVGDPARHGAPPSFDQLLTPSSSGTSSAPSALIMSQTPSAAPIVAPVTATGDVIVTGTFDLPEGLGSTGHAAGTADGKEVDAVLVDGELPAHSSPTPIAASSAISTHKAAGDVITPPTPEKGGRLMMALAITAGVLALALVGVLILAFVTGVFS